jgi:hypothetical protein
MLPSTEPTSLGAEPIGVLKEPVRRSLIRLVIVLAGLAFGRIVVYGPSLG